MYLIACPLVYCNNAVNKTDCIFFDLFGVFFVAQYRNRLGRSKIILHSLLHIQWLFTCNNNSHYSTWSEKSQVFKIPFLVYHPCYFSKIKSVHLQCKHHHRQDSYNTKKIKRQVTKPTTG